MAHRGASKAERENTLMAFAEAQRMGSHAVELDVRRCGSGELIVHHNPVLDDGTPLNSRSLGDLPGHIPTLDQALDACAGMWVNVEIKNDPNEPDFDLSESITRDTVELLRRRGAPDQWLVSSFWRETIEETARLWADLPTAYLVVDVEDATSLAKDLVASGHQALHPYVKTLTRETVDVMHAHGLAVNTWTCDDPVRMAELIEWGIDGICTNVPDVALKVAGF
jgi:glycerophosphoryl diester phosphodiesterase